MRLRFQMFETRAMSMPMANRTAAGFRCTSGEKPQGPSTGTEGGDARRRSARPAQLLQAVVGELGHFRAEFARVDCALEGFPGVAQLVFRLQR